MALIALLSLAFMQNCKPKSTSENDPLMELRVQEKLDSIRVETDRKINEAVYEDTAGMTLAPIIVTKAWFQKREYSTYKSVKLTYKNVGEKTVTAIRFSWKAVNSFGEPADAGSYTKRGYGGGFTDDIKLKQGQSLTEEWDILSSNGKTIIMAWPTEVVFSDGSKWTIKK